MGNGVRCTLMMVAMVPIITTANTGQRAFARTNAAGLNFDYKPELDYSLKYADLPVVPKRAALLFDQLMVALQKVVDNQGRGELSSSQNSLNRPIGAHAETGDSQPLPSADDQTMDLQRRGQAKGRVYWRCYFNAVTCFKKK